MNKTIAILLALSLPYLLYAIGFALPYGFTGFTIVVIIPYLSGMVVNGCVRRLIRWAFLISNILALPVWMFLWYYRLFPAYVGPRRGNGRYGQYYFL
ncbi:MAG: hypothetical protein QMC89_05420 [Candidatus Hodarchaeaceae archaeon]|nr:hypothetical protein [Candidatus Hodarchaeaceae archaeon]